LNVIDCCKYCDQQTSSVRELRRTPHSTMGIRIR